MLQLIPLDVDHVVGFRIEDQVSEEDYKRVSTKLEKALKEHDEVHIYAEIESFEGMSLDAFMRDLTFSMKHLTDLNRFGRAAIATDEGWIETVTELEGKLLPGVEVKAFPIDEKDRAMAWLLANETTEATATA